ncbi:MAG: thiamine pyrophosphate-dependent enzyme [Thermoanaerobaculia bacterium]
MLRIRRVEERLAGLFADGEVPGFIHLSIGQEAIAAGVASALDPADTIASTHRGHGHALAKGVALDAFFMEIMGRDTGVCRGRGGSMHVADMSVGMLGANGIVGAGIPLAVGSALAHQTRHTGGVAAAFFGDGALAEGVLHESLNLAALWKLPMLFVCENNGWSEFSPTARQFVANVRELAAAFGIESERVDGNDAAAVAQAAARQVTALREGAGPRPPDPFGGRRLGPWVAAVAVLAAVAAAGLPRIETDPGLLAYFDAESGIRQGLEAVDAAGGSSPLRVVFRDAGGGRLDTQDAFERLSRVQEELDRDPAVGTALSLAPLLREAARSSAYAGLLGVPGLVDLLSGEAFRGVARSFVTGDRTRGALVLRMREAGREEDRDLVVDRIESALRSHGFDPVVSGGLYELQGQLADLVASSLLVGLGGLAVLFAGIAWAVSRSLATGAAMLACLAGTPLFVFGAMGHLGLPVDFISSPAANVAVGMGIDSMIHLVVAVRALRREGLGGWRAWSAARGRLWRPVVGAAGILSLGFGLFTLSSFPPTRRFGVAVVVGLAAAAVLTLVVLPWLAHRLRRPHRPAKVRSRPH